MNQLKKMRMEMGLSQQALADKLNISQQSICKYENGSIEPNIEMLKSMADLFDVSVDYLIGYTSYAHKVEEVSETSLNEDELAFLRKYRSLEPSTRALMQHFIDEVLHLTNS